MNQSLIRFSYTLAVPILLTALPGCESTSQQRSSSQPSSQTQSRVTSSKTTSTQNSTSMPIIEERMQVGKREVQGETTRLQKRTVEKPVEQQVTLHDENVRVERRSIDRPVTDADKAFQDKTIEMVETKEVPMVSKQSRVTGEVALKKDMQERTETVGGTVRSTQVDVIRADDQQASVQDWSTYEPDFRKNYQSTYANSGLEYEQVQPAYRYGYDLARDPNTGGTEWSSIERKAKQSWERDHQGTWDQYRDAVRYGWERTRRSRG